MVEIISSILSGKTCDKFAAEITSTIVHSGNARRIRLFSRCEVPIPVEQTWDPTDPLVSEDVKNQAAAEQQEEAARRQAEEQAAAEQRAAEEAARAAEEAAKQEIGPGYGL